MVAELVSVCVSGVKLHVHLTLSQSRWLMLRHKTDFHWHGGRALLSVVACGAEGSQDSAVAAVTATQAWSFALAISIHERVKRYWCGVTDLAPISEHVIEAGYTAVVGSACPC